MGGPEFQKSVVGVWGEFFGGKFGFSGLQKKVSAGSKKSKFQKPSYNPQKSKIGQKIFFEHFDPWDPFLEGSKKVQNHGYIGNGVLGLKLSE